jgi:hypothetical protein
MRLPVMLRMGELPNLWLKQQWLSLRRSSEMLCRRMLLML